MGSEMCIRDRHQVNPMLITAVLFDEIQHSKPGENLPFIAHSGLVKTHGPAQISVSELIHQKLLPANPTQEEITWARNQLLDPLQRSVIHGHVDDYPTDSQKPSKPATQNARRPGRHKFSF